MYLLYILGGIFLVSVVVTIYEIHNATPVDPEEPFLRGDYDPKKK